MLVVFVYVLQVNSTRPWRSSNDPNMAMTLTNLPTAVTLTSVSICGLLPCVFNVVFGPTQLFRCHQILFVIRSAERCCSLYFGLEAVCPFEAGVISTGSAASLQIYSIWLVVEVYTAPNSWALASYSQSSPKYDHDILLADLTVNNLRMLLFLLPRPQHIRVQPPCI